MEGTVVAKVSRLCGCKLIADYHGSCLGVENWWGAQIGVRHGHEAASLQDLKPKALKASLRLWLPAIAKGLVSLGLRRLQKIKALDWASRSKMSKLRNS